MAAKSWKLSTEYQRILELLNDYWASESDELAVGVYMEFLHTDGQSQEKQIIWINPNYEYIGKEKKSGIIPIAEIEFPPEGHIKKPLYKIHSKDYRRKD